MPAESAAFTISPGESPRLAAILGKGTGAVKLLQTWTDEIVDDGVTLSRLSGEVRYADGFTETVWFAFPACIGGLSTSGNPWLAWMLPLATTLGEPIQMGLPVDGQMRQSVGQLVEIWRSWYPHLHPVKIEAPTLPLSSLPETPKAFAFFTGGVDSFYTVLRKVRSVGGRPEGIDALVNMWGFDVKLEHPADARRASSEMRLAASKLGLPLIEGRTNLRETRFKQADWGGLSHGGALAAVALCLEGAFQQAAIGASFPLRGQMPLGTHPDTDALLGTSGFRLVHDGAEAGRAEKVEFIARHPVALEHLRCCFRERGHGGNCGRCLKCYRTMLTLHVVGALDRCRSFDVKRFDLRKARRMYSATGIPQLLTEDLAELAQRLGDDDMVKTIEFSLRRSRRLAGWIRFLHAQGESRWARTIRRRILSGSPH